MANREHEQLVETVVLFKKEEERKRAERRKKKDWITYMSTILTFLAWIALFVAWALVDAAAPEVEWAFLAGFGRVHFDMEPVLRQNWDSTLVYIAYLFMISSIGVSAIALVCNLMRRRRKTDKVKKSIIITGGATIVIFVLFLMNFWTLLF